MRRLLRYHLPLKIRTALVVVLVVAALGLAIRIFVEQRLAGDMQDEFEKRGVDMAVNLSAASVEPILYQDWMALERVLNNGTRAWTDFEYAFVLDPTRHVLAHTLTGDFPEDLRRLNRFTGGQEPQVQRLHTLGFGHRDVAVPIYGGQLGVLHLGFRDQSIVDRLSALRRDIVLLLAAVALAGGLLAVGVVYRGLRPLQAIARSLEGFHPGRKWTRIQIRRRDEVGQVVQRINEITLRLHQAQIALDEQGRLATLGRFSAVIAHEVGNPLASIMTRLELMDRSDEERFLRESLPLIRGQLGRIQRFLAGASRMLRSQRIEPCTCDINGLVQEAADMLRLDPRAAAVSIKLERQELPPVRCGRDQLFQVIVNLGLNGLRAAGPEGTLLLATTRTDDAVCIEVADDGPGVAAEHRDKIFTPFFTSYSDGSGLGLTISRDLMREQGGDLRLMPGDERGARFQARLPLTQGDTAQSPSGPRGEG